MENVAALNNSAKEWPSLERVGTRLRTPVDKK